MISNSPEETKKFAWQIFEKLAGRRVLALYGELGSGKTSFVQGLAEKLGIEKRVLSPTFVFLRSYPLKNQKFKTFHHLDLYRANNLKDALSTGIEEILEEENSLIAIEWPEVIERLLPEETGRVRFRKIDDERREITFSL
jgi:tRNA threonylcarbamoyladenosine biosynthesis protein TsaE